MKKSFTMYKNVLSKGINIVKLVFTLSLIFCANAIFAQNLITNGCFEGSNVITVNGGGGIGVGFNTDYNVNSPYNTQSSATINTGANNSTTANPTYSNCADHTTGTLGGSSLVIQGANYNNTGSKIYEAQPTSGIPVTTGASYTFTYWIQSLTAANPANISVKFNGGAITPTLTVGSATAPNGTCTWQQVTYTFVANTSTVQIWMYNSTSTQSAFALDDITLTLNQALAVSASVANASCPGGTGSITAAGSGGVLIPTAANSCGATATYTYSNGGAFQSSPTFTGLAAGNYTITVMDASSATASVGPVTVTDPINPLSAGSPVTLGCAGTAVLTATGNAATDLAGYTWSPSAGLSSTNVFDPTASVIAGSSTLYTVSSSEPVPDVIVNGDFSAGNTGFTSTGYTAFFPNNVARVQGAYAITTNPSLFELNPPTAFTSCGDHTTGTGNMMTVDASVIAGQAVWRESVPVIAGQTYTFTYWIQSISATPGPPITPPQISPAIIQTAINGTSINTTTAPATTTCGNWLQVTQTWASGINTNATIELTDLNTIAGGNDFALDDISFTTTATCALTDTVRVTYGCILPITLLDFTATKQGNTVALNWTTATELNSSHFVIQTSTDGIIWTDVASIDAAGKSIVDKNYSYIDNDPANGVIYYRLKQVDTDGSYENSQVRKVDMTNVTGTILIYPNPVTDELHIIKPANTIIKGAVIIDAIGQTVLLDNTFDNISNSINVHDLATGFYNIRLIDNNNISTNLSFIKK